MMWMRKKFLGFRTISRISTICKDVKREGIGVVLVYLSAPILIYRMINIINDKSEKHKISKQCQFSIAHVDVNVRQRLYQSVL